MKLGTALTIALILMVFGGCTPPGDNFALRKPDTQPVLPQKNSADLTDSAASSDPESCLDPAASEIVKSYGGTIKHYAEIYGFDWRLILAVIKQESSFRRHAESYKGAAGLMQIMPVTGEEVARILDIQNINHPRSNIRGGIFYLRQLYGLFGHAEEGDRIKLSLAAYNAGIGRVQDAQELAGYLKDDPQRWQSVKDALPLLSKRYYTLHRDVWQQEKPKSGWFGNARETVAYVDAIMNYYDEYRLLLD